MAEELLEAVGPLLAVVLGSLFALLLGGLGLAELALWRTRRATRKAAERDAADRRELEEVEARHREFMRLMAATRLAAPAREAPVPGERYLEL